MRIALASARLMHNDIQHNMMQMKRNMIEAKVHQADIICFGEGTVSFVEGNKEDEFPMGQEGLLYLDL